MVSISASCTPNSLNVSNLAVICDSAERCRSGRTGRSRKPLCLYGHPGFESLSLRQPLQTYQWNTGNCRQVAPIANTVTMRRVLNSKHYMVGPAFMRTAAASKTWTIQHGRPPQKPLTWDGREISSEGGRSCRRGGLKAQWPAYTQLQCACAPHNPWKILAWSRCAFCTRYDAKVSAFLFGS